ncbi:MAG: DUF4102 domain-containing protein [Gammaproteobacteria bacterium]|nr:DUF4102 domain-containing protein [Gammaproteobacteria bacterium]
MKKDPIKTLEMNYYNLTNKFIDKLQVIDKEKEYTDSHIKSLKLRVPKLTKKDSENIKKVFYLYYTFHGKRNKCKIGRFGEIGITEARQSAEKLLAQISLGHDPLAEKVSLRKEFEKKNSNTLRKFLDNKYYPYANQGLIL